MVRVAMVRVAMVRVAMVRVARVRVHWPVSRNSRRVRRVLLVGLLDIAY